MAILKSFICVEKGESMFLLSYANKLIHPGAKFREEWSFFRVQVRRCY